MKHRLSSLQSWTESRGSRLAATLGLAFGLALLLLLLPITAGTVVQVPAPAGPDETAALPQTTGGWYTGDVIEVAAPFGAKTTQAAGEVQIVRTVNLTQANQVGFDTGILDDGQIIYTIRITNTTGVAYPGPISLTTQLPPGSVCIDITNASPTKWLGDDALCKQQGLAAWSIPSGDVLPPPSVLEPFFEMSLIVAPNTTNSTTLTAQPLVLDLTANTPDITEIFIGNGTGTPVTTTISAPTMVLTKTAAPTVTVGGQVTYALSLRNTGSYTMNPDAYLVGAGSSKLITIVEVLPNNNGQVLSNLSSITATWLQNVVGPGGTPLGTTKVELPTVTFVISHPRFLITPGGRFEDGVKWTAGGTTLPSLVITYSIAGDPPLSEANGYASGYPIVNNTYSQTGPVGNVYPTTVGVSQTTYLLRPVTMTVFKTNPVSPILAGGNLFTYTIDFSITGGSMLGFQMIDEVPYGPTKDNPFGFVAASINVANVNIAVGQQTDPISGTRPVITFAASAGISLPNGTTGRAVITLTSPEYSDPGLDLSNILLVAPTALTFTSPNPFTAPTGALPYYRLEAPTILSAVNDIQIVKTVETSRGGSIAGYYELLTYTIQFTNLSSNGIARNIAFTDVLTEGLSFVQSPSPRGPRAVLGDLTKGDGIVDVTGSVTEFQILPSDNLIITEGTNIDYRTFRVYGRVLTATPATDEYINQALTVTYPATSTTLSQVARYEGETTPTVRAPVFVVNQDITVTKVATNAASPTWGVFGSRPDIPAPVQLGTPVTYYYRITNNGTVDYSHVQIFDNRIHTLTPTEITTLPLPRRGSITIPLQYTVVGTGATQAADGNYYLTNTVVITPIATDPKYAGISLPAITATALTSIPVDVSNTISITKDSSYTPTAHGVLDIPTAFDTVTYTYRVKNNSPFQAFVSQVIDDQITPPIFSGAGPAARVIPPFDFEYFTKAIKLSEQNINNFIASTPGITVDGIFGPVLTNTVVVTANIDTAGGIINVSTNTQAIIPITYVQAITVEKKAISSTASGTPPGSAVQYQYVITNSGSVTQIIRASSITDYIHLGATNALSLVFTNSERYTISPGTVQTVPVGNFNYIVSETDVISGYSGVGFVSYLTNTVEITAHPLTDTFVTNGWNNLLALITSPDVSLVSGTNFVTDILTTTLIFTPQLRIEKQASLTQAKLNDSIRYEYTIENIGNMTLRYITGTDIITINGSAGIVTEQVYIAEVFTLAPGAQTTTSTVFTVDGGVVADFGTADPKILSNTAVFTGYVVGQFDGDPFKNAIITSVTNSNLVTVAVVASGAIVLEKAAVPASVNLGDSVTYYYTLTNPSTDPISGVFLYDNQFQYLSIGAGEGDEPFTSPLPSLPTTAYGEFGSISTRPSGTFTLTEGSQYTFSTQLLFGASEDLIFQAMRDSVTGSLITGAVRLYNAAYATGTLSSTVSAGVTEPIASNLQTATLTLNYSMGITFAKQVANLSTTQTTAPITANVGDRLLYTYTVYNTGSLGFVNLYLEDETLLDGKQVVFSTSKAVLVPPLILPAGGTFVYTDIVTVDANLFATLEKFAGSLLTNTARVVATPTLYQRNAPSDYITATYLGIVPQRATATQTVILTAPTDILVKKVVTWTGSSTMAATVGDWVTYTFVVTNNGTVAFGQADGGIDLFDDKLGEITPTIIPGGLLQPGQALTFNRSITLTSEMLIAEYNNPPGLAPGYLTNTVTATGYFANAFGDSTQAFTIADLPLTYTIDVTVTKSVTWQAGVTTPLGIGTPVTYMYVIEHVGPITQVSLIDVFNNGFTANEKSAITLSNSGVTTEYFQTTVLPNYMNLDPNVPDEQTITNTVWVRAVDPIGVFTDTVTTDTASLDVLRDLNLQLTKIADRTSVPIGEDVPYRFILTNTGKVSLTVDLQDKILQTARVSDTLIVTSGLEIGPGQTQVIPFTLTALDADVTINSAMITNVGVALVSPVGLSPTVQIPFSSNLDAANIPVPVTVTVLFTPELNVVKDIANPASGIARIDDVVTYTILVANVGDVTVRNIIFGDPLLEVSRGTDLNIPPGGVPAQFVVTQTITQEKFEQLANLGDNKITNTAFITGSAGGSVFTFTSNPEVLTIRSGASLDVDKSVTPDELTTLPGVVTYTYVVTNNGTVTLTNIELVDDKLGVIATGLMLARDEVTTFITSTTIANPDLTGFLVNMVTASTTFTGTGIVSDNATAVVRTPVTSVFTITLQVNPDPVTLGTPQVFMVTVPDGVTITQFTWNLGNGVITTTTEPVLTYTYPTTGTFNVTVTAVDENNDTAVATTTATVLPEAPFELVKMADPASGTEVQPNSTITYTVMLTNMGTETATNVIVSDTLPADVTFVDSDNFVSNNGTFVYSIGTLLPGGSQMGVITVTVNADAVGTLENSVLALSDLGAKTSNVVTHTLPALPRLHISKTDTTVQRTGTTTAGNPVIAVGDQITYTITVSNDGTADANNVVITDVLTDSLDFVSATVPVTPTDQADGTTLLLMTFASLPPQAQDIVVTLVVEVNAEGEGRTIVTNQASVDSDETDPVSSDLVSTQPGPADPTQPQPIVVKREPMGIYLPIILRQPQPGTPTPTFTPSPTPTATPSPTATTPGQPDLTSEIILEPANPGANDPVVVKVIVRNVGSAPVTEGFWVDFYINPQQQPSVARRWDDPTLLSNLPDPLGTQGIAWKVEPVDLQAIGGSLLPNSGNELVLVSRPFGDPANGANEVGYRSNTVWHGRFVPGTTDLYSYADSYDEGGSDRGVIEELVDGAFVNNGDQMTAPEFGPLGDPLDMAPVPPPAMPPRSNP